MHREGKGTPSSYLIYRPDIDGLRAVAVLSVVGFHAFPHWVTGGFIGVDVFFVISGFLISSIILKGLAEGEFRFSDFFARRIRRIFPALLLVLATSYSVGWLTLLTDEYQQLGKHMAAGAGFVSNLVLWGEAGYFDTAADTKPLLHLWSLGVEEQFYLVWPLALWLAWRSKLGVLWLTVLLMLGSFYLAVLTVQRDAIAAFYSPQTRLWEFLVGALLAWSSAYGSVGAKYATPGSAHRQSFRAALPDLCAWLGMLMLGYGFLWLTKDQHFPGALALIPVLGGALLIAAGPGAWVNRVLFSSRVAVWFGLISFPLYLWHWPLLSLARIVEGEVPSRGIRMVAVLIAIGLAWITYVLVERPLRWRGSPAGQSRVLVLAMLLMGAVGYATYHGKGLAFRSTPQQMASQAEALLKPSLNRGSGWWCDDEAFREIRCFYEGGEPTAVVIGDSHATAIYRGLKSLYRAQGKTLARFGGVGGCPPLLDVVSTDGPGDDRRHCIERMTLSLKKIIAEDSIKEVILTSRGSLYTTSRGFGDFAGDGHTQWVLHLKGEAQGVRPNLQVFEVALANTFDALLKAGKTVTFLHDVPELGFDIKSCLVDRPFALTSRGKNPCAVSREAFVKRNLAFRSMADAVLAQFPAVHAIDLAVPLCDATWCYGAKDGVLLYMDDDHLNQTGSLFVVKQLEAEFLRNQ
ncbi:MAG: acyltransferase family protein [Pseudomonas sp.]|uniref:acyltransferase family protein n=1 Tax=Pseudomonas sp. TaxID=306 RepID=UPI00339190E2